jgi:hypothetical protein
MASLVVTFMHKYATFMWILNLVIDFPMATTLDFSQDLMIHLGTLNKLVILHQNIAHKLGKTKHKHK